MKKTLTLIFAIISFLTTSCSTTRCRSTFPHLAGDWEMGGPYNIGKPCLILQAGNYLTFVNEGGDKSRGVLKDKSEVIALDWEGGLSGILTEGATRINWKNGTWWLKEG
jgi:hypothetical protein